MFFLKFTKRVTILQTVSNQKVTLIKSDNMLPIAQKLFLGRKLIYVRYINGSYNNVAKGICLLDKKAFLCFYKKKKLMRVRAFERYVPLSVKTNSCLFMFNDGSISTPQIHVFLTVLLRF